MNIILKPFAWLLLVFTNFFNSYGLALILFTLIIKVILFPFALKSKRSMIKTTMLQGRLQKIQKQYANNKQRQQEEIQKLYAQEKVNPMGGCLWSLLPLIILIPLYAIIRQPMQYLMDLTAEQIVGVAQVLDWDNVAVNMGWIGADVVEKAVNAAKEAGTAFVTSYSTGGYNELFLASLITPENLGSVQAVAPGALSINFHFLGLDLAQVPKLKFWEGGLSWGSIGLFLLPLLSVASSMFMSFVATKTNAINNPDQKMAGSNRMMMIVMSVMYLWFGFSMPGGLSIYFIATALFSVVQEIICGKILKKDYEAAAEARRKQELLDKEEEKRRKAALAEERAKRAEEKKKKGKKKDAEPGVDRTASRVGIRAYARGRAYDPDRYGGVTPYRDPEVDEAAIEAALEKKAAAREEAELEAEVAAQVEAEVKAELETGKLTEEQLAADAAEVDAEEAAEAEAEPEAEAEAAPETETEGEPEEPEGLTQAPKYDAPDYHDGEEEGK